MKRWEKTVILAVVLFACPACSWRAPLPPGDLPTPDKTRGYVGLPKSKAVTKAGAAGTAWRVVEEDGRPLPVTKDLRPDRLNFTIRDGLVVKVTTG